MTAPTLLPPPVDDLELLASQPIATGGYRALVFSGARSALGDVAGEPTWRTSRKYAMVDPRWSDEEDFAQSTGALLHPWPGDQVRPIPGVCFVLDTAAHPARSELLARGGREGEDFVILEDLRRDGARWVLEARLDAFRSKLSPSPTQVLLLGYGEQGARIARCLRDEWELCPQSVHVLDDGETARARVSADGHGLLTDTKFNVADFDAVIASSLARFARFDRFSRDAVSWGVAVFDNSEDRAAELFLRERGRLVLDPPADRAWPSEDPIDVAIVRCDERRLGDITFPHLWEAGTRRVDGSTDALESDLPDDRDPMPPSTWAGLTEIVAGAGESRGLALFAARRLLHAWWPETVDDLLPSMHPAALGATALERQLARHLGRAEIASASQTTAQQAALGVVAGTVAGEGPIIEIGSALGGSALLMAVATERLRPPIISIDPDASTRDIMRFTFQRAGHLDRLEQLVATSDDAIETINRRGVTAGVVFIDGRHDSATVRRDVCNYAPLVRPGGVLLLHDAEPAWLGVLNCVVQDLLPDPNFFVRGFIDSLAVFERRP